MFNDSSAFLIQEEKGNIFFTGDARNIAQYQIRKE